MAAAKALGEIRTSKSEADAKQLCGPGADRTSRLVAAALLRRHEGAEAVALLQTLAKDADPSVASAAVGRLSELGPSHVIAVLPAVMASEGADVRGTASRQWFRTRPTTSFALAQHPFRPAPGRARAGEAWATRTGRRPPGDRPGGVVEGPGGRRIGGARSRRPSSSHQLEHKPAARRLVSLLTTNRSEVAVAAGWALRNSQSRTPFRRYWITSRIATGAATKSGPTAGLRAGHPRGHRRPVVSARSTPGAMSLPRSRRLPADARTASSGRACRRRSPRWARRPDRRDMVLGLFNEEKPAADLVSLIESRLTGDGMFGPDHPQVRAMAAVTLARLGAVQSLGALLSIPAK